MKMSERGLAELAGHEGIVLSRYRDSKGIWTVGIGHTAAAGAPDPEEVIDAMTLGEGLALFRRDVAKYEADVERALKISVSQTEFDALVSFHYNTGAIGRAGLVVALNAGARELAGEKFGAWMQPPEVGDRRRKERRLFEDGVYSNGGKATVYPADSAGRIDWGCGKTVDALAALTAVGAPEPDVPPAGETIRIGHPRDVDVEVLQSALARLGLYRGRVDGLYGPKTAAAVVDFRRGVVFNPDVAAADTVLIAAVLGAAAVSGR